MVYYLMCILGFLTRSLLKKGEALNLVTAISYVMGSPQRFGKCHNIILVKFDLVKMKIYL